MDITRPEPLSYPFNRSDTLELDERYARLRAEEPMARVKLAYGDEAWLATRYADARFVLGDARFSRVTPPGRDEPRLGEQTLAAGMLSMDPPEQTRIRRLATKAFTNRSVESLRQVAVEVADGLVTTMVEKGPPVDLVSAFALPLPVTVICTLLGVPVDDHPLFAEWSEGFLSATGLSPAKIAEYQGNLWQYMATLLAERTTDPKDDLLSALAQVRENDDRFTGQEILQLSAGLLAAGHETTMSQIPNFVLTLIEHPAEMARIRENPDIIPQAVEELMRYIPLGLGSAFPRYAKEDIEVGGVLVRQGEAVLAAIGSANRDESAFPHADTLDVTRKSGPHIGFSHGAHHCLGAPLARMELQVALSTLLGRLPDLRLAVPVDGLRWKEGGFMRRMTEMPVAWG
ncbi:cytochrome P450 [Umezawaea tangerina]|uniref:Cytochrome P450 n=1 Tax=Umezawaea tangerina TaxID=84725 RepID=A0A2T0T1H2_9PSEU|nr:cytochrome P450 [Umezawaea tangerina]PRY39512.1 cytochrome P450 [Umezawaea tangerina]